MLFAILFLWQFPHFYSIAWLYRDDYSKAGIKMLPVIDETGERTARQILVYALILVPVSLLPTYFGMSGNLYLIGRYAVELDVSLLRIPDHVGKNPFRGAEGAADFHRVPSAAVRFDADRPSSPVNRGIFILAASLLLSACGSRSGLPSVWGRSRLFPDRSKRQALRQQRRCSKGRSG